VRRNARDHLTNLSLLMRVKGVLKNMVLVEPLMVKSDLGNTAGQTVTLKAEKKSFLIKDIMVANADATYTEILIDKVSVGFFRTYGVLGNHLGFPLGFSKHAHSLTTSITAAADITSFAGLDDALTNEVASKILGNLTADTTYPRAMDYAKGLSPQATLLNFLIEVGWMAGYPIADGQKLTIRPYVKTEYLGDVLIVYEEYDAGDMSSEMPNGSRAAEFLFTGYGDVGSVITTAKDYHLNNSNIPIIYPQFPFDVSVPSGYTIDILGILGSESLDYDAAADYSQTKYLKMLKDRKVLFDDERNGLLFYQPVPSDAVVGVLFAEGLSMVGGFSEFDRRAPFIFPEPLHFVAGEELTAYITAAISTAAGEIAQGYSEIGFIMRATRG